MRYKLSRPFLDEKFFSIIKREIKRQQIAVSRLSQKNLKEIAKVSKEIEDIGLPNYLVCKKLPLKLGKGIFLKPDAEPILKGQIIASYGGELSIVPQNAFDDGSYAFAPLEYFHLTREEQALWDSKNSYHPKRQYAFKLDALKKGNFTRFINHSEKPNVIADMLRVPKNSLGLEPAPIEIIYIARKNIYPGEQLLVSYEEDGEESYWKLVNIKPFPMTPKTFRLSSSSKLIMPASITSP